jgi:ribonuclease-3
VSAATSASLAELERALGHAFARPSLLEAALTHPSFAYESDGSRGNERLEFLGDAVLGLVVAQLLYEAHPAWSEGLLTRARGALVNERALAERARLLGLGPLARLGRSEQRTGGAEKDSILADLFEAVLGALYLDGGLAPVLALVRSLFAEALVQGAAPVQRDAKTRLNEWAQAQRRTTPSYRVRSDSGQDRDAERFVVEVWVAEEVLGEGRGRTKRGAEQAAAEAALVRVGEPVG